MVKKKVADKIAVPVGANNDSPVNPPPIPVDEFHGQGGSYILDPVTGTRTRVGANNHSPQPETEVLNNESE